VVRLQAGTTDALLAGAVALLAVGGLLVLARARPRLAALAATAGAGQIGGILWLSPEGSGLPIVLNRYLLPALPILLLGVACALAPPSAAGGAEKTGGRPPRAWRLAGVGAAAALLAALWWTGPLRRPAYLRGSFAHHNAFVDFTGRPPVPSPETPHELYARLPPGAVVELPWPTTWNHGRSFTASQLRHGRRVLVSATDGVPRHPGLRLRNEVPPTPAALLASPARVAVVHRCLPCEEVEVRGGAAHRVRISAPVSARLVRQGRRVASHLRRAWGPPHETAGTVVAWDLERVRRERAGAATAPSAAGPLR
jgi:hypothetical protein